MRTTAAPASGEARTRELRGRTWSVRTRMLAMMLTFMVAGLALAGGLTFSVQFAQLEERVERELEQEVDEIERLVARGPEGGGDGASWQDLDQLFAAYLESTVPGQLEAVVTLVDEDPSLVPRGGRPVELDSPNAVTLITETHVPGQRVIRDVELQGRQLRIDVTSVQIPPDPREGIFAVAIDVGTLEDRIWSDARDYTLISLFTIALAGVTGRLVTGRLLRPLTHLGEATSSITHDDLTRRVHVERADTDIAQLSLTFNEMLDRLETGVGEQRRFLDDAAHELRTPLTVIRGNLELVDTEDPHDLAQTHGLVLEEVDRMQRLVTDLLLLAKARRPDFVRLAPVRVPDLGQDLMERARGLGSRSWAGACRAEGEILVDCQRVQQAVLQLAANAVKFSSPGDTITLDVHWASPTTEVGAAVGAPAERYLVLAVQDTGAGIAPEDALCVFDRFARAEGTRHVEGSGLGLAIVSAIATAHQGTVTLVSEPGVGSTFSLWLPA